MATRRRRIAAAMLLTSFALVCSASGSPSAANLLAAAHREQADGKSEDALRDYAAAREASASANDEETEASAVVGMADVEYQLEHYDRAGALAAEGVALARKAGALATEADALKLVGNVKYEKGESGGALEAGERILAIREQLGDRAGVGVALNNIATIFRFTDPLREIRYLDRSQHEFEALADARRAVVLNNIADAYRVLGNDERAVDYSDRSLAVAGAAGNPRFLGIACNIRGVIETWRGDYPAALGYFERALAIHRKAGFEWGAAEVLNNIGNVYQEERNHARAIDYLVQALAMNQKLGDQNLQAEALTNLAREYFAIGKDAMSAARSREALRVVRRITNPPQQARTLNGLAHLEERRGRRSAALESVNEAIALERSVPDRRDLADSLVLLGIVELSAEPIAALAAAREAVDAATATENWDALWQADLVAGRALRHLGGTAEAASAFDASISTIEADRARVVGAPEALPLYFADKVDPYRERAALAVAAGDAATALGIAERSKSRVLYDVLRKGRIPLDRVLSPAERESEQGLRDSLASLNIGLVNQPSDAALKSRRDEKRAELETFEAGLYARHPEIAFQRGAEPPLTPAELMSAARVAGAAVLDYLVTPRRTYLFAVSPGGSLRVRTLPVGAADLRRRIGEFRRELSGRDLAFAPEAAALFQLLVAPAEREIAGARGVVVVPDRDLWNLPFGALQPRKGRFWIEDLAISYAPSLGVLRETCRIARERSESPAPRSLLAFGNPRTALPPLPEAERQVREIGKLYGGDAVVRVGAEASEHRFLEEAPDFRVLHLASHAVLDDVSPPYSHVVLAGGGGEDGRLEARKLAELDLKAEMLVLSGCETARGEAATGEGITGMLWASFVAGAPTTVASLWKVESASTSDLMIEFHRQWLATRGKGSRLAKAEALAAAARKLIASGRYAHPFYWAGFILAGSPG